MDALLKTSYSFSAGGESQHVEITKRAQGGVQFKVPWTCSNLLIELRSFDKQSKELHAAFKEVDQGELGGDLCGEIVFKVTRGWKKMIGQPSEVHGSHDWVLTKELSSCCRL